MVTGALVQWLRNHLRMIDMADEIEALANTVDVMSEIIIVPAILVKFEHY